MPDARPNPLDHQGLVWQVAYDMRRAGARVGFDMDDLVQIGEVGLLKACEGWEAERGTPFYAYAKAAARQEIVDEIRSAANPIRLPAWVHQALNREAKGMPPCSASTRECLQDAKDIRTRARMELDDAKPLLWREAKADDGGASQRRLRLRRAVSVLLSVLTERQRDVTVRSFGLESRVTETVAEIASDYGVDPTAVRQSRHAAIRPEPARRDPAYAYEGPPPQRISSLRACLLAHAPRTRPPSPRTHRRRR